MTTGMTVQRTSIVVLCVVLLGVGFAFALYLTTTQMSSARTNSVITVMMINSRLMKAGDLFHQRRGGFLEIGLPWMRLRCDRCARQDKRSKHREEAENSS